MHKCDRLTSDYTLLLLIFDKTSIKTNAICFGESSTILFYFLDYFPSKILF